MKQMIIGPNDAGQRLDKFLLKAVPLLPKSLLYKYVRLKRIKCNGKRCEIGQKLNQGDELSLYINDEFFVPESNLFLAAPADVSIVYEDSNILLVDKPVGLVVHEDESGSRDTLIHRIQHYLYQKGEYQPAEENSFAPALCNRIDRNTGGIVIAAKNFATLMVMNQKIKEREINKYYLCLVYGTMSRKSDVLKGFHSKDSQTNTVKILPTPFQNAKTALTKYKVLDERGNISLLEVELLTGRTHQIRAHMAAIGHPLVGDTKYGSKERNQAYGTKQALYSYKLTFSFESDAAHLNYLNGKSFQVEKIDFLEKLKSNYYEKGRTVE